MTEYPQSVGELLEIYNDLIQQSLRLGKPVVIRSGVVAGFVWLGASPSFADWSQQYWRIGQIEALAGEIESQLMLMENGRRARRLVRPAWEQLVEHVEKLNEEIPQNAT